MKNVLIINAHQPYPFSEGKLNATLVGMAASILQERGYLVKTTSMVDDYDIETELEKHQWADAIILQSPVNWMGVPWTFKKYMDEVYSAGMFGMLCDGDGRHRSDPTLQYGTGGTMQGKKYMISLTFNAPAEAFDDDGQYLFGGKGLDDLAFPMHMNFRFFGMEPLKSFACFDVMKNPDVKNDFVRFRKHLEQEF